MISDESVENIKRFGESEFVHGEKKDCASLIVIKNVGTTDRRRGKNELKLKLWDGRGSNDFIGINVAICCLKKTIG